MFVLSLSLYNTIEFKVSFFYAKSRTCSFIVLILIYAFGPKIILNITKNAKKMLFQTVTIVLKNKMEYGQSNH